MSYQYTPAAERALNAAAGRLPRSETELTPLYVLFGLLSEPECRAAKILEAQAIDEPALRAAWPEAEVRDSTKPGVAGAVRPLSSELETAFHSAILHLDENPRTCQLATEHLLLGLATSAGEVGRWLRDRGVNPDAMVAEICARYGIDHSPIPLAEIDLNDPPIKVADEPIRELESTPRSGPSRSPAFDSPSEKSADLLLLRILDASANRAGEAIRVVEDYVRFALDDRALTALCKQFRHDLTAAVVPLTRSARLAARDTLHDVGTELSTPAEKIRVDLADVAAANVRRLQESLRSLEEFGKVLDPEMAARCEQLRYRAYTLQQRLETADRAVPSNTTSPGSPPQVKLANEGDSSRGGEQRRRRLEAARLYVLLDGRDSEGAFISLARSLVEAGVDVLQLRDKHLDDRTLLARARLLREVTRVYSGTAAGAHALFIMNDRPDLAALADADGVHIGQEELTVADARRIVGGERLIGVSTHSIEQARQAVADNADYLGLGPTFPSTTKLFETFPGLDFLRAAAQEIDLPAFAIGGITAENIAAVRAAGVHRVAMSGAILNAVSPHATSTSVRAQLYEA